MESRTFNFLVMGLVLAGVSVFCPSSEARDAAVGEQRQVPAAQSSNHKHYECFTHGEPARTGWATGPQTAESWDSYIPS